MCSVCNLIFERKIQWDQILLNYYTHKKNLNFSSFLPKVMLFIGKLENYIYQINSLEPYNIRLHL